MGDLEACIQQGATTLAPCLLGELELLRLLVWSKEVSSGSNACFQILYLKTSK
jgi:hypothetical protein